MTKRRRQGFFRRILTRTALALALLATTWLFIRVVTWPNVARLAHENPKKTAFISRYERTNRFDDARPELRWDWVSWNAISPHMKRAVVVSEDAEFFMHAGFSEREIRAAVEKAIKRKKLPRGASTITQQVAKNLWLSPSRNPLRKVEEALLTRQLEDELTKRRILEIYLNIAEFGPGVYGVEAASRTYFRKSAADLGSREAASLAASLPKPSTWHPGSRSRYYHRRTSRIERMMARAGFLRRYLNGPTTEEVAVAMPRGRKPGETADEAKRRLAREARERREEEAKLAKEREAQREEERLVASRDAARKGGKGAEATRGDGARGSAIAATGEGDETEPSVSLEELMAQLKQEFDEMRREEKLPDEDLKPGESGE